MIRPVTRRQLLRAGGAGAVGVGLAGVAGCSTLSTSGVSTPQSFEVPLPIPPVEHGRMTGGLRTR